MIRLLSPIWGKSNELNSCHNTLYFVDCPQSRGTVHSGYKEPSINGFSVTISGFETFDLIPISISGWDRLTILIMICMVKTL